MDNLQTQMNESQQQEKVREPLGMIERIISNFFRRVHTGKLEVYFPSGNVVEFGNNDNLLKASLKINSLKFSILISVSGDLGFAESYIRGYLDTPDLTALLNLGSVNESPLSDVFQTNIISKFVNKYINEFNEEYLEELNKFLNFDDEVIFNFYQNNLVKDNIDQNKISKLFKDFKI